MQARNKVKVNENAKQRKMRKRTTGFSLLWYDALLCCDRYGRRNSTDQGSRQVLFI